MSGRQISPHFNEDELRCKCGCGRMEFSDMAIDWLEKLRVNFGGPIRINSGYRCPEHNAAVSSTGLNGPHTITTHNNVTVDISEVGGEALDLVHEALKLGFTGVGVKQKGSHSGRFIHLDRIVPGARQPRPYLWGY